MDVKRLKEDIEVVFEQDPAARSYFEVILTYSGLHAFGPIELLMHFV